MKCGFSVKACCRPVWDAALLAICFFIAGVSARVDASDRGTNESVRQLIEESIRMGVPLYNGGQPEACAAVYRTALRSLELFVDGSVDKQPIQRALRAAAGQSVEESAWTLRYALDEVYARMTRQGEPSMDTFALDFSAGNGGAWYVVNDNVMGGVSQGGWMASEDEVGVFAGRLSLRNNGGFSSVRTRVSRAALAGHDGIEMRVRGDGRRYAMLAGIDNAQGSWQYAFTAPEEWETVRVPFEQMALSIRGWRPNTYPPIDGRRVETLGFIISDKDERPFRMEIDWMRGYRE